MLYVLLLRKVQYHCMASYNYQEIDPFVLNIYIFLWALSMTHPIKVQCESPDHPEPAVFGEHNNY